MQFTCWTCPEWDETTATRRGTTAVRRSCNELVIYYAPSWRGLINGQRIGSDLASMSALIGRVRSSTAFAKLMQIMRGSRRWWCKRWWWWSSGWWWWGWWGYGCWCGRRINAGLMSQVAQKGFCGCVCLDSSRANPWPDKLYELCRLPKWITGQARRQTPHIVNVILGPRQGDKTRQEREREKGRGGVGDGQMSLRCVLLLCGSIDYSCYSLGHSFTHSHSFWACQQQGVVLSGCRFWCALFV